MVQQETITAILISCLFAWKYPKLINAHFLNFFLKKTIFQILINSTLSISFLIPEYATELQNFKGKLSFISKYDPFNYSIKNSHLQDRQ